MKRYRLIVLAVALMAAAVAQATDVFDVHRFLNAGLQVFDTDGTHTLALKPGSNLTVDRQLTILTGDSNRSLTLSGDFSASGTCTGSNTGDDDVPDAVDFDNLVGGTSLTYDVTNNDMDWDGMQMSSAATEEGKFLSQRMGSDFTPTKEPACVGGTTDEGKGCATNADCNASAGVCTADKRIAWALESTVYRLGTPIQPSDLPSVAVRTDVDRTGLSGVVLDWGVGHIEIPNSTSTVSATLGRIALDTNGGSSGAPFPQVYDGANALPMRDCQTFATVTASLTNADFFISPGIQNVAASRSNNGLSFISDMALTAIKCLLNVDLDDSPAQTLAVTVETATLASCTGVDGSTRTCTWADSGFPACTFPATSGTTDFSCSAVGNTTIASAKLWQLYINVSEANGDAMSVQCATTFCPLAPW